MKFVARQAERVIGVQDVRAHEVSGERSDRRLPQHRRRGAEHAAGERLWRGVLVRDRRILPVRGDVARHFSGSPDRTAHRRT
jgi:hypothetical protein